MSDRLSTIDEAIDAIAQGQIVIVMDDEDRENEGDFICAAEKVTPEIVNFMITHGRGQLCMPILPEVCQRLDLPPMVEDNTCPLGTGFTVPVDHRNCRTGITAPERAMTILAIVDPDEQAGRLRPARPPLSAGGQGRRRAAPRRATPRPPSTWPGWPGLQPAGVLCEILDESGDRAIARGTLRAGRASSTCAIITIEQLIRYRRRREKLVYRMAEADLPTKFGTGRIYRLRREVRDAAAGGGRLGRPDQGGRAAGAAPLVLLHRRPAGLAPLRLRRPAAHGHGDDRRRRAPACWSTCRRKAAASAWSRRSRPTPCRTRASTRSRPTSPWATRPTCATTASASRSSRTSACRRVRLLTNNPKKTDAFIYGGFDLEVVDQVPIVGPINEHNQRYLATKRDKMGHKLP